MKGQHGQDPEEGASVAPEDRGAPGGGRRDGPGSSECFILRALGSHRGQCMGKGQSSREVGAGQEQWEPWATQSHPTSCWEPRWEPRALLATFIKEIWAMGAPGWGFIEKPGFPHPAAAESGARAWAGAPESQPLPAAGAGS